MAIFHFSAKTVSRAEGRSSTAAAAYRAAEKIIDSRTGEIHDFKRKSGVIAGEVVLPGGETLSRSTLWNAVESAHKRKDSVVAREFEIAVPCELTDEQSIALISDYCKELADQYHVAVDWNLHDGHDDNGNGHAHVLMSACYCEPDGTMGKKAVELDPIHCKRAGILNPMEVQRERWQNLCNGALERAGHDARIDHRTLQAQGITDRLPGVHLGPDASGILRRGESSEIAERARIQADEFMARMQAQVAIEQAQKQVEQLQAEIAVMEREEDDRIRTAALAALAKSGAATDRACAFAQSDHTSSEQSLDAAGADLVCIEQTWHRTVSACRSSASHLNAGRSIAHRACQGAERRIAENYVAASFAALNRWVEQALKPIAFILLKQVSWALAKTAQEPPTLSAAERIRLAVGEVNAGGDFRDVRLRHRLPGSVLSKALREEAPAPVPVAVPERQQSPQEASREAMTAYAGQIGRGLVPLEDRGRYLGNVAAVDDHHALQHVGHGIYVLHLLDDLDVVPVQDDPKTEICYDAQGRGEVNQLRPELDQERPGAGR